MDVESFVILAMQISSKFMISCVITTLKVNVYQRKSDLLRINFIISRRLIQKNQIMRQRVPGLHRAYYEIIWLFLCMHVIKVSSISPFNHLKCINVCLLLIALRISSITLLCKLQNATEKSGIPDKCQQSKS